MYCIVDINGIPRAWQILKEKYILREKIIPTENFKEKLLASIIYSMSSLQHSHVTMSLFYSPYMETQIY